MTSRNGSMLSLLAFATLCVPALLSVRGSVGQAASSSPSTSQTSVSPGASGFVSVAQQARAVPSTPAAAAADRKTTQQIRRSIIADQGLSIYAHNCFILTRSGDVTLKGVVRTGAESRKVEQLARTVAGPDHVHNSLSVLSASPAL
jgi:osmotically-inducible protein OsmY